MAYPTGQLGITLTDIDRRVIRLKDYVAGVRAQAAAGNVTATRIIDMHVNLKQERAALSAAAAAPGLADYARDVKNDQNLDVVAEFTAMIAAIDDVVAWVEANFPKDASGYLQMKQFTDGALTERMFTPAQTAGFRAELDGLLATIA